MRIGIMTLFCASLGALLPLPGMAEAGDRAEKEKIVREFYDAAVNRKDFAAAERFLGPAYIQHNQHAADGKEGLRGFIGFLRDKYPKAHSEIRRVFVDGDFVILHVHSIREPGSRGAAVVDIFRLEQGKVVEHWDVHEDIIENPANGNGMF